METTTEKESMTNNVLISKKEYDELIKYKSNLYLYLVTFFDVELKSFVTSYNKDIDKLREECSQKDIKITQLTNEIERLRKQIKK